jgi:hypothetical protein
MKKAITSLLAATLVFVSFMAPAQIFHENFEVPDSVFYFSNSTSTWASNSRIATSGVFCDSAAILNVGDSMILTTLPFSTLGIDSVYLYFNHIAKVNFFDQARVEVSPDGGISWIRLKDDEGMPPTWNNCTYYGMSPFRHLGSNFSEACYAQWWPGINLTPLLTWWQREIFSVSALLGNKASAQIRFVLTDITLNGGAGRSGWYIDDILVTDSLDTYLYPFLNTVKGKLFVDMNSNQIQDAGEPPVKYRLVKELNSPYLNMTNSNGDYSLRSFTFGVPIVVQPDSNIAYNPYFNLVPFTYSVTFPSVGLTDSLNDFAVQPDTIVNDLRIRLSRLCPRSSFATKVRQYLYVYNDGSTIMNPDIVFYPNPMLTFDSASVTPTFITADSIGFSLSSIFPFQSNAIQIYMQKPPGLASGTLIVSSARVEPLIGDINPSNNDHVDTTIISASYDPNMIEVNHSVLTPADLSSSEYLEYRIYFQNTGNDTAYYVRVENMIPANLNLSSFEFLSASHDMRINYDYMMNPRKLSFVFDNILLPDSGTNQLGSNGFIHYRIKPLSNLNIGDSISSKADIYFDFNPPVITNYAVTTIVDPTSIVEYDFFNNEVVLFPNPSTGDVQIGFDLNNSENVSIEVYNLFGQNVKNLLNNSLNQGKHMLKFNLSELNPGIYLIIVQKGSQRLIRKVVLRDM